MQIVEIKTESLNLTEEQFFKFCVENKELRIERDKNKTIIIMAPTGGETGNSNIKLGTKVEVWNEKDNLGYCFDSNTGFTLPNKAMRSPDVSWIPKEKWENLPREDRKRFAHICPDFVIELVSESDTLKEVMKKMEEWIENGCRLGWLIDPESITTFVYKPNMKPAEVPFSEMLSGETVLPGFELMVGKIILP
jgi:Uma2 family endonuclease